MTPLTASPELSESQADKEETANEAFRRIESGAGFFQIVDRDLTAPPVSSASGDRYIVGASATGAWSGHDGDVAYSNGVDAANGWLFRAAAEGLFAWVADESAVFRHDGADWVLFVPGAVLSVALPASEDLAANDLVNIWSDSGVAKVRKADADDPTKEADGLVASAVASGATAAVYVGGVVGGYSGLTDGAAYFLSATAGVATATAPSSIGQIVQRIGKAISDTQILVRIESPTTL
jgi:hypothetical protein